METKGFNYIWSICVPERVANVWSSLAAHLGISTDALVLFVLANWEEQNIELIVSSEEDLESRKRLIRRITDTCLRIAF